MKKRIVAISDLHTGHRAGLTPKQHQFKYLEKPRTIPDKKRKKYGEIQRSVWDWYTKEIKSLGRVDVMFFVGDGTDGTGNKDGGTELITSDLNVQVDMAVEGLSQIKAKKSIGVYGSPYHVSPKYMDLEDQIAKEMGFVNIGSREFVEVEGVTFDLKHKVGKSSIPHGQGTMLAKQWLWNEVWSAKSMQPRADVYIRGHIHDENVIGKRDWMAISLPGMEWSSKYGTRMVDGIVSVGFLEIIVDKGEYTWQWHIANLGCLKAQKVKI